MYKCGVKEPSHGDKFMRRVQSLPVDMNYAISLVFIIVSIRFAVTAERG